MTDAPHVPPAPTAVIAGCGFIGMAVAQRLHGNGWSVLGLTYSRESLAQLADEPFQTIACDIADPSAVAKLPRDPELVVHCASSRRGGVDAYRRVYLQGARTLLDILHPRQLLFTSSTSVYPQVTGEWVTEESAAEPARETSRVLRETEEVVLAAHGTVARLAGIYGPGRSVLLQKFFRGEAVIEGDGSRWINQVHRDDVASAVHCLAEHRAHGIFNVADNQPCTQLELWRHLSARFGRPLPPHGAIDFDRKRAWTNKRVSNAKLRALGWTPIYRSFFDAIENDAALLHALVP